jgi:hypothetical protein
MLASHPESLGLVLAQVQRAHAKRFNAHAVQPAELHGPTEPGQTNDGSVQRWQASAVSVP